jgi:hypothetical protein
MTSQVCTGDESAVADPKLPVAYVRNELVLL